MKKIQNLKLLTATLAMLAWSGVAFCGEIHDAAEAGDLAKVKALLEANPDLVNAKADCVIGGVKFPGSSPLHVAAYHGRKDIVELLLSRKADANAKDDNWGSSPLYFALITEHKEIVELLLANKADVNAKDKRGWTPLHHAVSRADVAMVKVLLASKADVNAKDNAGFSPLHEALSGGVWDDPPTTAEKQTFEKARAEIIALLRQHGAKE